jgi:plastocyanin
MLFCEDLVIANPEFVDAEIGDQVRWSMVDHDAIGNDDDDAGASSRDEAMGPPA